MAESVYLLHQLFPGCGIAVGAQCLMEKGEQHRHDNTGFDALPKTDKKD
jgi:imidazoleglycerol phosphate synthase glutamine amidotransferase subunit HisH